MSKYTTGEIAKLCGVTVRTVQYYDSRNLLVPSALSQGGRRLYSEEDLKRMKIICFLRELGLPIHAISQLLTEENPGSVIQLLLEQQGQTLEAEITERQTQLEKIRQLERELRGISHFSVESIGDIAYMMEDRKNLRKVRAVLLGVGIPLEIVEWTSLLYAIHTSIWWPWFAGMAAAVIGAAWMVSYYYQRIDYLCPKCHSIFRPGFREMFFARHTPTTRRLTCTCCGHKGFCVEVYRKEETEC